MQIAQIPYQTDPTALFAQIAQEPWAVWLDSGHPQEQRGRYDIISAAPYIRIYFDGTHTHINDKKYPGDPYQHLRQQLQIQAQHKPAFPFLGGAIGYWAYELPANFPLQPADHSLPLMAVGIYDWAIIIDHQNQQSHHISQGRDPKARRVWTQRQQQFNRPPQTPPTPSFHIGTLQRSSSRAQYQNAYQRIQAYIQAGDCYQVNLAQRFHASTQGQPWALYQQLRAINPAPYAAYINLPQGQILSSSPEQFIQQQQNQVSTRPIKGTRPQLSEPHADQQQQQALQTSPKDRAENIMIVDLMRNDLGKICQTGSIHVPELCKLHSFATVHHLISRIEGELKPEYDAIDILKHCLPGGSITGAPKKRAMEIIAELESHQRGIYCGSIGYISYDGQMDSNIAIRTLVHDQSQQQLSFWAGGGIVADSNFDSEYQESFDKAAALIDSLKAFQATGKH